MSASNFWWLNFLWGSPKTFPVLLCVALALDSLEVKFPPTLIIKVHHPQNSILICVGHDQQLKVIMSFNNFNQIEWEIGHFVVPPAYGWILGIHKEGPISMFYTQ